jgi:hypothetical protein
MNFLSPIPVSYEREYYKTEITIVSITESSEQAAAATCPWHADRIAY